MGTHHNGSNGAPACKAHLIVRVTADLASGYAPTAEAWHRLEDCVRAGLRISSIDIDHVDSVHLLEVLPAALAPDTSALAASSIDGGPF